MIPFPNLVAGILVGIANDSCVARLVVPFIWGIVFCVYILRRRERNESYSAST